MWQTKYALAVAKNLGLGLDFRPCSEGNIPHRAFIVRLKYHTQPEAHIMLLEMSVPKTLAQVGL